MKSEQIDDSNPESTRKSLKNWVVNEPGGRYKQAAKILCDAFEWSRSQWRDNTGREGFSAQETNNTAQSSKLLFWIKL